MTGEVVNRWLTVGANFGVLIGLILLLLELNQNSDLLRAQIHQSRSDAQIEGRLSLADAEFLLPAMEKLAAAGGLTDLAALDQLTPIELARFTHYLVSKHQDYDNLFYQYQHGYLDEEFYRYSVEPSIRIAASWWRKLKIFESSGRRPSFNAGIERIMTKAN